MNMAYKRSLVVLVIALVIGLNTASAADESAAGPLVRVNCRLSGKLYIGEHYLGEVKAGFQYPVNDLKPGQYTVRIVGDTQTWENSIDVSAGKPVVIEAVATKAAPEQVPVIPPEKPEVKPPVVVETPPAPPVVVKAPPTPPVVVKTPPAPPVVVKTPPAPPVVKPAVVVKTPPVDPDRSKQLAELNLKLAYIKPGSFKMGDKLGKSHEKPEHTVVLTKEFWMGTTEVTANQFKTVLPRFRLNGSAGDQPVVNVSWWEAMDFCNALNLREAGNIPVGYHYRLPTEAEWEYCFRSGNTARYVTGSDPETMAPYAVQGRAVASVASKKPNTWGLYDMVGNVQEWCLDGIPSRPKSAPKTYVDGIRDPVEMLGPARVVRGGHYASSLSGQYPAYRKPYYPVRIYRAIGFRVVLASVLSEPSEGSKPKRRYK